MQKSFQIAVIIFVGGIAFTVCQVGKSQRIVRTGIYNRIVTIRGHVEVIHPESRQPLRGSGAYLVFQREGCADCLIATHADDKGEYKILVGPGRYKLIVYNPSSPKYDLIAPNQSRYVHAVPRLHDTQFDIKLIVPSEP
jgi:hypothetical protein